MQALEQYLTSKKYVVLNITQNVKNWEDYEKYTKIMETKKNVVVYFTKTETNKELFDEKITYVQENLVNCFVIKGPCYLLLKIEKELSKEITRSLDRILDERITCDLCEEPNEDPHEDSFSCSKCAYILCEKCANELDDNTKGKMKCPQCRADYDSYASIKDADIVIPINEEMEKKYKLEPNKKIYTEDGYKMIYVDNERHKRIINGKMP